MPESSAVSSTPARPSLAPARRRLRNAAGLTVEINANGSLRRIDGHGVMLNLFPGNEVEGGPANIHLRRHRASGVEVIALLGPGSPSALLADLDTFALTGEWQGLQWRVELRLADTQAAWFWHVQLRNVGAEAQTVDLVHVQDLGLSSYAAIRLNEYYVSHYLDLTPFEHPRHGTVLAVRQNLAQHGRHPWAVIGSLGRAVAYATDALQVHGLALRAGGQPEGLLHGLPGVRLQHEHALAAIQEAPQALAPGQQADLGFFGRLVADHPGATDEHDLGVVEQTLALPQAAPSWASAGAAADGPARTWFSRVPMLLARDLTEAEVDLLLAAKRRHEEREGGVLLSFFHGECSHVVLRAKELRVLRPHGHILRSGGHRVPDEASMTSTAWMSGVFHSMLTQGHVSINRFLSTVHSWLGLYRSQGQRVFLRRGSAWLQLGLPSAFEIEPEGCRWIYRHEGGTIEVRSGIQEQAHAMTLQLRVLDGPPARFLLTHHVALAGDDGQRDDAVPMQWRDDGIFVGLPPDSELDERFPGGGFLIEPLAGSRFAQVGGDEMLFEDGLSRAQPFVCIATDDVVSFELRLRGRLLDGAALPVEAPTLPRPQAPPDSPMAPDVARLADIAPWYWHNALVHYLAPRGLEQYTGGGWGTRDVCQGPLEMLLALDCPAPVRDLLRRVFEAQNADGDWPQWFTFFERERDKRAGDSHGDIVLWPLLALARYLLATEDAALLDLVLPFHTAGDDSPALGTVWQHVERALQVLGARRITGTHLTAYGHGDWNDSLQPADPALREHLCSAWTVTLHHDVLTELARALRRVDRAEAAERMSAQAAQLSADFQRLLVVDGVVTGYALFAPGQAPQMLLHPKDELTGVRYSLLPMMHAVMSNLLSPDQARSHLELIQTHLVGPDGARLFDRPLPYRGGPEQLFQRAESSAFFGRECGVMYTHAHLRYAQALAHAGDAERFFDALCKAHPLGLRERVASASLRQSNCYFSSSDAAFADRYEASRDYGRVADGSIPLDGGWRVYSSGPGIALAIVVGQFLGIRREYSTLIIDPVIPAALDGLRARVSIGGREVDVEYQVGPLGHGLTKLVLNGHELAFRRGKNPYRIGAAEVSQTAFDAWRSADGGDVLHVRIG